MKMTEWEMMLAGLPQNDRPNRRQEGSLQNACFNI